MSFIQTSQTYDPQGLRRAVAEIIAKLPEFAPGTDLDVKVIVERFPARRLTAVPYDASAAPVYAYQFLKAGMEEGTAPMNIGTYIPSVSGREGDVVALHLPGGRPYEIEIPGEASILHEISSVMRERFSGLPNLDAGEANGGDGVQAQIKRHGVVGAQAILTKLENAIKDFQDQAPDDVPR